jgi:hypothetical protein
LWTLKIVNARHLVPGIDVFKTMSRTWMTGRAMAELA